MSDIEFIADDEEGFFDLPAQETCADPHHDPPMHLYIPPGKGYRHRCPTCGKMTEVRPKQIRS